MNTNVYNYFRFQQNLVYLTTSTSKIYILSTSIHDISAIFIVSDILSSEIDKGDFDDKLDLF